MQKTKKHTGVRSTTTPEAKSPAERHGHVTTDIVLAVLPVVCIVLALGVGTYQVSPARLVDMFASLLPGQPAYPDAAAQNLIMNVRLPRVLAAALAGAGLSIAGAVFQGVFNNPLASPYTLGVSNGAGFGAGLAILFVGTQSAIQGGAVLFALIAMGLTFLFAMRSRQSMSALILSGMLIGSLFASLVSLLKFVADPTEKLPQIVYWLMGSFSGVRFDDLLHIVPLYVLSLIGCLLYRWRINVLSMGDTTARSFGIPVMRDRTIVIACASVLAAVTVSICGIVGWVGIVVPHLARMMVGPDFRRLMPASCSLGICYMLLIDTVCRSISAVEVPVGVITGIVGVPMFLYFIFKKKVDW